ncbi:MAG: class I mannose-6-phosphate isomerase [Bacteroidales bacterium]|nr:class I mannose-6-phosphate isomerase [Bacteroidales bacterium]MCF8388512.1 class I mannose-6-phosphate isomerase [Bacteroidales bacterium]MCF8399577.1 class I mannose-6-phosphate isomerase [Bacteroidales bacterium]
MNRLYPLKFKPIFKEKIWGGDKMRKRMNMDFSPLTNCGEAWVLSGVQGYQSVVSNGFLEGNQLDELIEVYMQDLVGDYVFEKHGIEFPVLIKFIDSRDWLSIQVHPDDELAAKRKIGNGKTEMWYVLDADQGAELISGFNRKLDKNEYMHHLRNKSLREILNFEEVEKGDVFYMPAGRVHALGPGVFLTEIQQTSDITYRIYDWNRMQADGTFRELHTKEALEAIDFSMADKYKTDYQHKENETSRLVDCPYFTTNIIRFNKGIKKDYTQLESFVAYVCTEGDFELHYRDGSIAVAKGEVVLIPAELKKISIIPLQEAEILEIYQPRLFDRDK